MGQIPLFLVSSSNPCCLFPFFMWLCALRRDTHTPHFTNTYPQQSSHCWWHITSTITPLKLTEVNCIYLSIFAEKRPQIQHITFLCETSESLNRQKVALKDKILLVILCYIVYLNIAFFMHLTQWAPHFVWHFKIKIHWDPWVLFH